MNVVNNSLDNKFYRLICFGSIAVLLLFPLSTTMLTAIPGAINFFIVLSVAVFYFKFDDGKSQPYQYERKFYITILFIVAVVFAVTAISGIDHIAFKKLAKYLYLLSVIPIYWFFRKTSVNYMAFWYGLVGGAVISAGIALYDVVFEVFRLGYEGRAKGATHPIIFGDLALLMGVMAIAGIGWFRKAGKYYMLFPLLAAILGILASFLSHSRGGWISIPVIALMYAWLFRANTEKWKIGAAILLVSVLLVAVYAIPATGVANKVHMTIINVNEYFATDVNHISHTTSIGSRFEMWLASWQIFMENPLFGVGWGHYQDHAKALADMGLRNASAWSHHHPHNQFFSAMANGGILGLIATLGLFIVPILIFIRIIKLPDSSEDVRRMALAGLIMVVSFAIFNLSESFLERSRTVGFFVFYLAVTMAGVHRYKPGVSAKPS